ncbi:DUF6265 family protein [Erythrobacter sp. HKB08]|uniref:DUF6265 family protein n=1 Tax=Erythrobacter sp. HKB08 TaxID=2502843 RepID=UPI0013E8D4D0|nr:DUF6265 family protein [Erythrobacter sp. HKB08]
MRAIGKLALAVLAMWALPLGAQETRVGEEGFESPPATLAQMDWLVGQWAGKGIGDAPAMESWLPPTGGTMVGTFVQESGEGGIQFTEHLYLMEEEGTLVLRLKHFNADLTGWEEKADMLTFRLVAIEDCAAYFHALTLRCDKGDDGEDGLVAAVRMQSGAELLFRFERMGDAVPDAPAPQCGEAASTAEMNQCYSSLLTRAADRRKQYVEAASALYADAPDVQAAIVEAEAAFDIYRDRECRANFRKFGNGSFRTTALLICALDMTDARTRTVWNNWLVPMADGEQPVLPEPGPTR